MTRGPNAPHCEPHAGVRAQLLRKGLARAPGPLLQGREASDPSPAGPTLKAPHLAKAGVWGHRGPL